VIVVNRDSGEIVWDKQVAKANEFGSMERFRKGLASAFNNRGIAYYARGDLDRAIADYTTTI
jgi:Tetratricopeptide repeat